MLVVVFVFGFCCSIGWVRVRVKCQMIQLNIFLSTSPLLSPLEAAKHS